MFLWTLPWTTKTISGLLLSTTTSPPADDDDDKISWIWEICLIDLLILLPLGINLGQFFIRIAASLSVPKPLRRSLPPSIYTTICQFVFADIVLFGLLWSVSDRVDLSKETTTTTTGWNGPFLIFTIRFLTACAGVAIGETFFPLALTGGIACGKSTISKMLRERFDFKMIDADKIGHQILLPPWHADFQNPLVETLVTPSDSVYVDILRAFASDNPNQSGGGGDAVPGINEDHPLLDPTTKCIDRLKLGAKVFASPSDRKTLNAITHPRIFKCLLKNLAQSLYLGPAETWVCAEIPLLFESGPLRYVFGLAIVVACTPTQQLQRLRARNPELSKEQCQNRIDSQMPMTTKIQKADIVIWNDKDYTNASNKKDDNPKEEAKTDSAKKEADGIDDGQEALTKQVEKAVQMIQNRVRGIMDTTLTKMLLILNAAMVLSCWYKLQ